MANLSQIPQQVNDEQRHVYEYLVDLTGETAPVHVMHYGWSLEARTGSRLRSRLDHQNSGATRSHCRVTGLELDLAAIKEVTPYCEQVIQADLNSEEWPRLLDGAAPFDVVVAADVLEHLYDPWITLKRMAPLINETGYLVISLPHVGHAAVVSCLINSDFDYRDWGLLDRTHIRFFGIQEHRDYCSRRLDLKIIEARYVLKPPEETEFSASWSSALCHGAAGCDQEPVLTPTSIKWW